MSTIRNGESEHRRAGNGAGQSGKGNGSQSPQPHCGGAPVSGAPVEGETSSPSAAGDEYDTGSPIAALRSSHSMGPSC